MKDFHPKTLEKLLYKDFKVSSPERWRKIVTAVNFVREQIHQDLAKSNFQSLYGVSIFDLKSYFDKLYFSGPFTELDTSEYWGIYKNVDQKFGMKWEHTVSLVSYFALGFENHSGIFLHPIKTLKKNPLFEEEYAPWECVAGRDRRSLCRHISHTLTEILDAVKTRNVVDKDGGNTDE